MHFNSDMDKRKAVEFKQDKYTKFIDIVKYLIECREDGLNIYVYYNGHRLYSSDITLEKALMEVYGLTLEEFTKYKRYLKGATEEQAERILADLPKKVANRKEKIRAAAEKIRLPAFYTLEEIVEYLQDCKRDGKIVYIEYKGCRLYSYDATLETAQKEIKKAENEADKDMKIYTPPGRKRLKGAALPSNPAGPDASDR